MRIKKIEWPAPFRGWLDRPTVEVALPFNSKAIIFRESPRMWVWKIIRWMAWDIQEGEASSLEKAKEACQVAWEKIVMEALDVDECYGVPKGPFAERQKVFVDTVDMASMTLDEAITHCNDIASRIGGDCGKNHKMLAFWLTEYRRLLQ